MDRQEARQWVKQQLESYLTARGLPLRRPFNCLNPDHDDRHPSMSFDRRRNKVHCFSCGADYDLFDLIGLEYNLTQAADKFAKAYELYGLENKELEPIQAHAQPAAPDQSAYLQLCRERLELTDYPARRGLSPTTCQRFGLGFDPQFQPGPGLAWAAIIIPTGPGCFAIRNTDPEADKNNRIRKRGGNPIFNAETLWNAPKPIFIVEGEIDALALAEIGAEAVALGSTAGVNAFLKLVEVKAPAQPLLIALDNDYQGRAAAEKLTEGLKALELPFYQVEIYGRLKDAGEALVRAKDDLTAAVREAENIEELSCQAERSAYLATSAAYHLTAFKAGLTGEASASLAWPTGFAALDTILEGGLYEGLYIMGGVSSLGKTSLALQLADQLAEAGREVLIFSLEMARSELMAKSISRLTLLHSLKIKNNSLLARTARNLTTGSHSSNRTPEEIAVIEAALERYREFAHRIFISEGTGKLGPKKIRREVDKHWRHTGRLPAVIVDYLQILATDRDRATDKQNIDQAVLELKRLSRDFKIPVIALSSFNRSSYRETAAMESFKESGAIEYSSDVLWGLQFSGAGGKNFDALAAKNANPRYVEMVILKNRHGLAGRAVPFEYYSFFNYFRER